MPRLKTAPSVFIFFACLIFLLSGKNPGRAIPWDANIKLTWNEFHDTTLVNSHRAALTAAGIRIDAQPDQHGNYQINVPCEMYPEMSWVDRNKKTDYLLSHEQYHFNITEYWARKLRKDVATGHFTAKNIMEKVRDIQKEDFKQWHEMENVYDQETNHSVIEPEQKKWEKKVDEMLKGMEKYSASTFTITVK